MSPAILSIDSANERFLAAKPCTKCYRSSHTQRSSRARRATARLGGLHGRTGDRSVGAEDATVAGLWPQHRVATRALMEVDAGIGWHGLDLPISAVRAGQFTR